MGDTVACLSVRQPWADLIVSGIKDIENRGWPCRCRGLLVIHAGKTWGKDEERSYSELLHIAREMGDLDRERILIGAKNRLGGLVGSCVMTDCVHERNWFEDGGREFDGEHEWFIGPYGWRFTQAKFFRRMIPYKGQQGVFSIPKELLKNA